MILALLFSSMLLHFGSIFNITITTIGCFAYQEAVTEYQEAVTEYQEPVTKKRLPNTKKQLPNTKKQLSNT
jgi:hypothetical protein